MQQSNNYWTSPTNTHGLPSMASLPGNPQEDGGIEDVDEEDHKSLTENVVL